jgi:hypothetical protein
MTEDNKKLSVEVMKNLQLRRSIISKTANEIKDQQLLLQLADREFGIYFKTELNKLGLDIEKKWSVDEKTGEVTEEKEEVKVESAKKEE